MELEITVKNKDRVVKKKAILLLLVMSLSILTPVFSSDLNLVDYEPYSVNEFPDWSVKLRRGESLFFGSLAVTMPLTMLSYSVATNVGVMDSISDDTTEVLCELSVAAGLSLCIAIADYVIGEME